MKINFCIKPVLTLISTLLAGVGMAQVAAPPAKATAPVKLLFEKVYVHTDRDYYTAGDDIWFKAYLVDAQTNLLNNSSNNLHVDLVSPQGQIFSNEVMRLTNGTGVGDFKLTDSIPAGSYRLRAYTNWQLNFGSNFIFEKNITVYNTEINSRPITVSATGGSLPKLPLPQKQANGPVIRFFPEGGSMVENVAGLVAFKAEDPSGKIVTVKGNLVSSTGDTLSRFESVAQGMGSFVFIPEPNKTYTIKGVFNNNQPFSTQLPAALPKGYVLHVSNADSAHLRITISTNEATMADNPDKEVTFMARHAGVRFLSSPIKFVFLQINATVPKNKFPAGVSSVTIYDKQLKPQCERLVYVPDSTSAKALTIKTDKQQYTSKEKVTVSINTAGVNEPVRANLSVSVVDANAIPVSEGNIASYLMLQSEVKGTIEHPEMYFDQANANRYKQLDLLLMTQGWRDFVWRRLADDGIHITHATENGFAVTGSLRQKFANKPIPGANVTLTVKGEVLSEQFMAKTDSEGKYAFNGIPIVGNKEVTLASFDDKKKKLGWIQLDSLSKNQPPVTALPEYTGDAASEVAFEKAVAKSISTRSKLSDTVRLKEVKIKGNSYIQLMDQTTTKFGYPDFKYDITSKYYSYNSLRDFLLHEVPGARSNDQDSVVFKGVRFDPNRNADKSVWIEPRMIVNGREDADDVNNGMYLNLPMDMINKVLVRHVLGSTLMAVNDNGDMRTGSGGDVFLIFLDIKPNAFDKVEFNAIDTHLDGYYQARTFYKALYDTNADLTKADNRTTIHWEPNVITNGIGEATVTFYNADPKTKVRVVVEGITDKGVPVAGAASYVVK
ncbi:MG2 domain-containing protein [Mucilaginibacter sp. AW1-3]